MVMGESSTNTNFEIECHLLSCQLLQQKSHKVQRKYECKFSSMDKYLKVPIAARWKILRAFELMVTWF